MDDSRHCSRPPAAPATPAASSPPATATALWVPQPPPVRPWRRWLAATSHWLLPPRCVLCESVPDAGPGALCAGCRGDLQANSPACPRCAEPLRRPEPLCGRCLRREPPFHAAFAACRYAWPLDGLVARFKFNGDVAAGRSWPGCSWPGWRGRRATDLIVGAPASPPPAPARLRPGAGTGARHRPRHRHPGGRRPAAAAAATRAGPAGPGRPATQYPRRLCRCTEGPRACRPGHIACSTMS